MAVAFEIVYSVADEKGTKPSTFAVQVPITFNLSQYVEFAAQAATIIDALLAGRIQDASLCFTADVSALTGNTIGAASDVEERGRFAFLTGDNREVRLNVPALNESLVQVGSDDLDLIDVNVAAVESMMLDGIAVTLGTIVPCDVDEADLTSLIYAREGFTP